MREEGWPPAHYITMAKFFTELDIECSHRLYRSNCTLIEYQATVQKAWFDTLGTIQAFNPIEFSRGCFQEIKDRLKAEWYNGSMVYFHSPTHSSHHDSTFPPPPLIISTCTPPFKHAPHYYHPDTCVIHMFHFS